MNQYMEMYGSYFNQMMGSEAPAPPGSPPPPPPPPPPDAEGKSTI